MCQKQFLRYFYKKKAIKFKILKKEVGGPELDFLEITQEHFFPTVMKFKLKGYPTAILPFSL